MNELRTSCQKVLSCSTFDPLQPEQKGEKVTTYGYIA